MKYLGKIESEKDLVNKSYVDNNVRIVDEDDNTLTKRNFIQFVGKVAVTDDTDQQYTKVTIDSEDLSYVNIEFTLSATGWNEKQQVYYNEYLTATCPVFLEQLTTTDSKISVYGQQIGSIVFTCDEVPQEDINFKGVILTFKTVDEESFLNILGKYIFKEIVTLSASNWVDNSQTVTVEGIYSESSLFSSPTEASKTAYENSLVQASQIGLNTVTFTCVTTPTTDVQVELLILNGVNTDNELITNVENATLLDGKPSSAYTQTEVIYQNSNISTAGNFNTESEIQVTNMSEYQYITIICLYHVIDVDHPDMLMFSQTVPNVNNVLVNMVLANGNDTVGRQFEIRTTGIGVGTSSINGTLQADYAIPYQILGIKGVVTNS